MARRKRRTAFITVGVYPIRKSVIRTIAVNQIFHTVSYHKRTGNTRSYINSIFQQLFIFLRPSRQSHSHRNAYDDVWFGTGNELIVITDKLIIPTVDFMQRIDIPILRKEI